MSDEGLPWLLVSVTTGSEASLRVHVWRQLRKLGAVYLQSSVCVLPALEAVVKAVHRLDIRVNASGGSARVLQIRFEDLAEEAAVIADQRAGRDTEYAEVVERVPQLLDELARETDRGRASYAEVEESEADLERFDRWLASIAARDYFDAPGGAAAREAVERCRTALADFEAAALAAETEEPTTPSRRLRLAPDQSATDQDR